MADESIQPTAFDEASAIAQCSCMQAVLIEQRFGGLHVRVCAQDDAWTWVLFEVSDAGGTVVARVSISDEFRIGDVETVRPEWTDFLPAAVHLDMPAPPRWWRRERWRSVASAVIATEDQAAMRGAADWTRPNALVFEDQIAEMLRR